MYTDDLLMIFHEISLKMITVTFMYTVGALKTHIFPTYTIDLKDHLGDIKVLVDLILDLIKI